MIGGYEEELIKQMFDLALVILNLKKKILQLFHAYLLQSNAMLWYEIFKICYEIAMQLYEICMLCYRN